MRQNFDRALKKIPLTFPCNKAEQMSIWRRKLEEEKEGLAVFSGARNTEDKMALFLLSENVTGHERKEALEKMLRYRAQSYDHLFLMMHRIAYFEGLIADGFGYEYDTN